MMDKNTSKSEQAINVDKMVDRFLRWELPKDFSPDSGIEFTKPKELFPELKNPEQHWPTGTNLFDATQAEEMINYLLADDESERVSKGNGESSPLEGIVRRINKKDTALKVAIITLASLYEEDFEKEFGTDCLSEILEDTRPDVEIEGDTSVESILKEALYA